MYGFEMDFPAIPSKKEMKEITKQVAKDRFEIIEGKKDNQKEDKQD